VLKLSFHKFRPQGVTGILLLSESHMSIHTWPEKKFAIFEMVTCRRFGSKEKNLLLKTLADALQSDKIEIIIN
jgi:S-adenosylmethionine/arginine decarboxylase-like enzyme